ncbi:AAA family ATPase [Nonomuraea lactucae]|uniref:AAA family ATPase n=1 Tax=Nonomuraea lactucae TaxID=2249762 RepID=UPI000DE34289|nr:MoxR family ATPase [Nonomuraea lactucae]
MSNWFIYTGSGVPHDSIDRDLPPPPPWRVFTGGPTLPQPPWGGNGDHEATSYQPDVRAVEQVNAALFLRRPLLVTGPPGAGKSTLATAVAHELRLGPVLHWPITSRVTLLDGLYQYDPLTRLYAASREEHTGGAAADEEIGRYIRLGPLGTALLPFDRPRVLLIDEIDKSDMDLPNDLLTIFEKGCFEIPELQRHTSPSAEVMTADGGAPVAVSGGVVRCRSFPLVIMTSNGEREFPPAFLRRCVTLRLHQPTGEKLERIVAAHLGSELVAGSRDIVERFLARKTGGALATDQLLNAVYLLHHSGSEDRLRLADRLMPYLDHDTDGTDPDGDSEH